MTTSLPGTLGGFQISRALATAGEARLRQRDRPLRLLVALALAAACASQAASEGQPEDQVDAAAPADARKPPATAPHDSAAATSDAAAEPADTAAPAPDAPSPADAASPADTAAPEPADAAVTAGRSPGCNGGGGLPEGNATIMVGGATRSYVLRLPAGYNADRAWPLVLGLHPNGGAGVGFWDGNARPLRTLLKDKAVLVLPVARPMGGGFDWRGDLPADLAYFDALITRLEGKLCIDTTRIAAVGFSGGGSFAGVLGCVRKDIGAIASGSGVIYFDPKTCVGAPAAWITVGQDELIPARQQFRDHWWMRAGCQATTSPTTPAGCTAYACPTGTAVHFCPHPGGHLWPDFGTEAAVAFFERFW